MSKKTEPQYKSPRTLENVTLQFPRLHEPEEGGKYSVQCINVSDRDAEKLKEIGLSPRHGNDRKTEDGEAKPTPEWGYYITPRTQYEFEVYDGSGRELRGDSKDALLKKIGSGTKANVTVQSGPYSNQGKKGVSCYIVGVQVIKLEEGSGRCDFKPVDGGYVHEEAAEDNVPY